MNQKARGMGDAEKEDWDGRLMRWAGSSLRRKAPSLRILIGSAASVPATACCGFCLRRSRWLLMSLQMSQLFPTRLQ